MIDLERTDIYDTLVVPDEDVELCLKVLRTVREACLRHATHENHEVVQLFSKTHDKLVELAALCSD